MHTSTIQQRPSGTSNMIVAFPVTPGGFPESRFLIKSCFAKSQGVGFAAMNHPISYSYHRQEVMYISFLQARITRERTTSQDDLRLLPHISWASARRAYDVSEPNRRLSVAQGNDQSGQREKRAIHQTLTGLIGRPLRVMGQSLHRSALRKVEQKHLESHRATARFILEDMEDAARARWPWNLDSVSTSGNSMDNDRVY
jgi:hypothetical protein